MGFNGLSLFNGKNLIMVYHGLTMVNNHYIDRNHDRNHDSNHSNHKWLNGLSMISNHLWDLMGIYNG